MRERIPKEGLEDKLENWYVEVGMLKNVSKKWIHMFIYSEILSRLYVKIYGFRWTTESVLFNIL